MRRLCMSAGVFLVAIVLAACSGNDAAPSPTPSPTPTPTPTVSSVVVSGTPTSAASYQMTANARLSDGSTRDVTTSAQWQSSNTAVAQVSSAGVLTVLNSGQVDVRAIYENVTGTMGLTVTLPPSSAIVLTGFVSEAAPVSKVLEGVKITITTGPDAGSFTYSNETGIFRFPPIKAGSITLTVNHPNYQPWVQTIVMDHDASLPIVLYPEPPRDASGATATARCRDGSWSWEQTITACAAHGGVAYPVCPGILCSQ